MAPAERLRTLNDDLRKTGKAARPTSPAAFSRRAPAFVAKACAAVRAFASFTDDNDPWQEHDCATLQVDGETVIFKIDYYDLDMKYLSADARPADPPLTAAC